MIIDLKELPRKKELIEETVYSLDHVNWMGEYYADLASGNLILINKNKMLSKSLDPEKNSLFDPMYGASPDIDDTPIEFACECQELTGRFNEGEICPSCNTIVETRYSNAIKRRGWIDLGDHMVIVPGMYATIERYIGEKNLKNILRVSLNQLPPTAKDLKKNPYIGIGMMDFYARFEEIIEYFKPVTRHVSLYPEIISRKNVAFTTKIMVMSPLLRPGYVSKKNRSFKFNTINNHFIEIVTDIQTIKKPNVSKEKVNEILFGFQVALMEIYNLIIQKIHSKEGVIKSNIISSRLWYTSRHVIISATDHLDMNEIKISYKGFVGLYELELINLIIHGVAGDSLPIMNVLEAKMFIKKCMYSNDLNVPLYNLCQKLINERNDEGLWILVNRPPTLDIGSLQMFKIVDIYDDPKKLVMGIQVSSLGEFDGDFDGDTLSVVSPKEQSVKMALVKGFSPSTLSLCKSGGLYNNKMEPLADESVFLNNFTNERLNNKYKNNELIPHDEVMKMLKNTFDFDSIVKDMTNNETFQELDNIEFSDYQAPTGEYVYPE